MTSSADLAVAEWAIPTWRSSAVFRAKVAIYRLRRSLVDLFGGPGRLVQAERYYDDAVVAESRSPLWSDERPEERRYQLGKVQNLRHAVAAIDRVVLPAGVVFSFWRQIGRASRRRGYVPGRMLQQGCLVPAVGGGLCQLSNALYDAALQAGCEIVERHA
ncbi:MAG TPA: VanW family protein, partial [Stellaceae bacterium]|nr:VanW family protein [Stellaceae bacterium]